MIVARANTPRDVELRLNSEMHAIFSDPDV